MERESYTHGKHPVGLSEPYFADVFLDELALLRSVPDVAAVPGDLRQAQEQMLRGRGRETGLVWSSIGLKSSPPWTLTVSKHLRKGEWDGAIGSHMGKAHDEKQNRCFPSAGYIVQGKAVHPSRPRRALMA